MHAGKDYIGVGVGAFIFDDAGKLLLTRRGPLAKNEVGAWIVPGGTVDFGETLSEATLREVREELGIEIELGEQFRCYDHILPKENQHWVATAFFAKIVSGEPRILEPGKCDEIGWFTLDALPSPIAEVDKEPLAYLLKQRHHGN